GTRRCEEIRLRLELFIASAITMEPDDSYERPHRKRSSCPPPGAPTTIFSSIRDGSSSCDDPHNPGPPGSLAWPRRSHSSGQTAAIADRFLHRSFLIPRAASSTRQRPLLRCSRQ